MVTSAFSAFFQSVIRSIDLVPFGLERCRTVKQTLRPQPPETRDPIPFSFGVGEPTGKPSHDRGRKIEEGQDKKPGRFLELLESMMDAPGVARDAYRIASLSNFFNGPVYVTIQKHYGLIRDEINTLFCLAHFPDSFRPTSASSWDGPRTASSRSIARWVQRDLISVRDDPGDGRKGVLSLRPRGRELYEKTRQLFVEREEQILASLTKSDRVSLDGLLTKIMKSHENWSELF